MTVHTVLTLPLASQVATKVLRLNLHRPKERMDAPKCMTLVPGIRRRELIGAAVLTRLSLSLFTRNSRSQVSIGFPFEFPPINFEIHSRRTQAQEWSPMQHQLPLPTYV
jgi:hypothetical protein